MRCSRECWANLSMKRESRRVGHLRLQPWEIITSGIKELQLWTASALFDSSTAAWCPFVLGLELAPKKWTTWRKYKHAVQLQVSHVCLLLCRPLGSKRRPRVWPLLWQFLHSEIGGIHYWSESHILGQRLWWRSTPTTPEINWII